MTEELRPSRLNILPLAVWLGLCAGLVEGILFLTFEKAVRVVHVSVEIIWISTLFGIALFAVLGLLISLGTRLWPGPRTNRIGLFLLVFLVVSDWLGIALYKHVHQVALLLLGLGLAFHIASRLERRIALWRLGNRTVLGAVGIAVVLTLSIEAGLRIGESSQESGLPPAPDSHPNIVLIVIDALRSDHLSSYGYSRSTSPNLDRIAKHGALFESAFSTSSYTLPSHASLLSGRFPYEHGVDWLTATRLKHSSLPVLPEVLQGEGYRTGAFSGNVFWFTSSYFDRGFVHFDDYFSSVTDMALRTFYGRAIETHLLRRLGYEDIPARKTAPMINRSLLQWMDRDQDKPFFAFVNYMDCHDPYLPPSPYRERFSSAPHPGGILNWRVGRQDPALSDKELQSEIDAYDGSLAFVDHHIGKLIEEIGRRKSRRKTLLIVTSDHGESFGERGLYLHGHSLYRELIQVPLMLSMPGVIPEGIRISDPVSNASLPASVLEMVGKSWKQYFPVPSLLPLLPPEPGSLRQARMIDEGHSLPVAEVVQQYWTQDKFPVRHGDLRSVIGTHFHFIHQNAHGDELYDWKADPREQSNLIADLKVKPLVDEFRARITRITSQIRTANEHPH
jgi:arylsulfatase A-like enzyme